MRALAKGLAAGRIGFGVLMLLRPEDSVRPWIGARAAGYGGTQAVTQAFGARDLSLGAGALVALMSGKDARDWVLAGGFADAADLVVTATADDIPLSGRLMIVALASGAIAVSAGYLLSGGDGASGRPGAAA